MKTVTESKVVKELAQDATHRLYSELLKTTPDVKRTEELLAFINRCFNGEDE